MFENCNSSKGSNRQVKMNDCSFQEISRQNLRWFLSKHGKTLFLRGFILKPTQRPYVFLKIVLGIFKKEKQECFYETIKGNFDHFQYFNSA